MTRAIERSFPTATRVSRPAEGICFARGEAFSTSGRFANCLRLSRGHSWDKRIERGVARLGALVTEAIERVRDETP